MKILNAGLDIYAPKIGVPSLDIHGPKIDAWIDIHGPKIGAPSFDMQGPTINVPSLDIHGPKIDVELDYQVLIFMDQDLMLELIYIDLKLDYHH